MVDFMKKIRWSLVFNSVVIAVSAILILYFIFSEDGLRDLIKSSQSIAWTWIGAALVCHLGNSFLDSILTWQFTRQKYKKFKLFHAVKTAVIGHFFSAVTPGASGGQPMQVFYLRKMGIDIGFSTSMLTQKFFVYQFVSTVYSLLLFIMKSKFILSQIKGTFMILFVAVGFLSQLLTMTAVLLACFKPKLIKQLVRLLSIVCRRLRIVKDIDLKVICVDAKINAFNRSNRRFFKRPVLLIIAFFEVALQVTLIYAVPYFIYKGLVPSGSGSLVTMLCAVAFVNVVSSMIPIPGASGVSELAFSIFFGVFFTPATMKSAILIWRVITYYLTILVGAPFTIIGKGHTE